MSLQNLTPREASMFACLVDTVVAPAGDMPAVAETDAVAFLDRFLGKSPSLNRLGMRVLLYAAEMGPLVRGQGARLRRLPRAARQEYAHSFEGGRLGFLLEAFGGMGKLAYYGDDDVMRRFGYDPDQRVARGRELRAREGRW